MLFRRSTPVGRWFLLVVVCVAVFLSSSSFCVFSAAFDCSTAIPPTRPLGAWQLGRVGAPDVPGMTPTSVVIVLDGVEMTGKVYYEHEPTNTAYLSAELYTIPGGGDGDEDEETTIDCAQAGTPIATQRYRAQTFATPGYNAVHAAMDATECFPQTATGVVSAFEFVLQEPFVAGSPIWDASTADAQMDGTIRVCARIAYKNPDNDEIVDYLDTRILLNVTLAGTINFSQVILLDTNGDQITGNVEEDATLRIEVDSFLCGTPAINDGKPFDEAYSMGQSFRICVDVKEEDREDFKLEKFETVTCKNSLVNDDGNVVIDEASATSVITETHDIAATIGAKNFDGDRESSDAAISFSTVVTNSLFPTDKTVASSIVCEGTVEMVVETDDNVQQRRRSQRRHLLSFGLRAPSSSSSSSSSSVVSTAPASSTRRIQADADQSNAGTFGTTIQLNALVSSSSSSSSPKFLSSIFCSVVTGMVLIPSMTSMVMMTMT